MAAIFTFHKHFSLKFNNHLRCKGMGYFSIFQEIFHFCSYFFVFFIFEKKKCIMK